jgi:hypothetical protein
MEAAIEMNNAVILAPYKTRFGLPSLVELMPYVERHRAETQSANGH